LAVSAAAVSAFRAKTVADEYVFPPKQAILAGSSGAENAVCRALILPVPEVFAAFQRGVSERSHTKNPPPASLASIVQLDALALHSEVRALP
jgi:hypothetical protein